MHSNSFIQRQTTFYKVPPQAFAAFCTYPIRYTAMMYNSALCIPLNLREDTNCVPRLSPSTSEYLPLFYLLAKTGIQIKRYYFVISCHDLDMCKISGPSDLSQRICREIWNMGAVRIPTKIGTHTKTSLFIFLYSTKIADVPQKLSKLIFIQKSNNRSLSASKITLFKTIVD